MLITKELLQAYNGITHEDEAVNNELIDIHIGTAHAIISKYVGFDCNTIETKEGFNKDDVAIFKNVCLRIATLLQLEDNGNIGVSSNSELGTSRTFVNIVDYTPYLKPLSAYREIASV